MNPGSGQQRIGSKSAYTSMQQPANSLRFQMSLSQLVTLPILNGGLLWTGLWARDSLAVQANVLSDLLSPSASGLIISW